MMSIFTIKGADLNQPSVTTRLKNDPSLMSIHLFLQDDTLFQCQIYEFDFVYTQLYNKC